MTANLNLENERFLDVVNENDEVVDSRSRTDVHRLGLLHREVHVWMFDKDHNIFFQKRSLDRPSAGLLDATVGGHVDQGEDYMTAAIRETKEETNLSVSPTDLVLLKRFKKFSAPSAYSYLGRVNNCIRNVYIYKKAVREEQLKKEEGLLGVDFKKISIALLRDASEDDKKMFIELLMTDELLDVMKYLNNTPNSKR